MFEKVQVLNSTVALIHARDIDLVHERKMRGLLRVVWAAYNLEAIDPIVKHCLKFK